MDIKVVKWISYEEAKDMKESPLGGLGGWFDEQKTYQDFFDSWQDVVHPYIEAMRKEIIENDIKSTGDWHQNSQNGVPVYSDGTVSLLTYRAWGDLLAAIWNGEDGKPHHYMEFYM